MKDRAARDMITEIVKHLGGEISWKDERISLPAITIEQDHNSDLSVVKHDQEIMYGIIERLGDELGYSLQHREGKLRWFKRLTGIESL